MPDYKCLNIGVEGYPVWVMQNDKATIAAIEPNTYHETGSYFTPEQVLLRTVLTLVVDGCCVEVKTPASVENVCAILGFTYQGDVAAEPTQPAPPDAKPERGE